MRKFRNRTFKMGDVDSFSLFMEELIEQYNLTSSSLIEEGLINSFSKKETFSYDSLQYDFIYNIDDKSKLIETIKSYHNFYGQQIDIRITTISERDSVTKDHYDITEIDRVENLDGKYKFIDFYGNVISENSPELSIVQDWDSLVKLIKSLSTLGRQNKFDDVRVGDNE